MTLWAQNLWAQTNGFGDLRDQILGPLGATVLLLILGGLSLRLFFGGKLISPGHHNETIELLKEAHKETLNECRGERNDWRRAYEMEREARVKTEERAEAAIAAAEAARDALTAWQSMVRRQT